MDSIFSELPRDLRFLIYKKFMHAMFREERAAIKKYFRDQVQPEILDDNPAGHFVWVTGIKETDETVLVLRHHYQDVQFINRMLRIRSNGKCDLNVFENYSRHSGQQKFNMSGIVLVYEGPQVVSFFSDTPHGGDLLPIARMYNLDGNDAV